MWWTRVASAIGLAAALGAGLLTPPPLYAGNPNEIEVKPQENPGDKDTLFDKEGNFRPDSKVWVLDFVFKPPRLMAVDVPGRGRKICWYLWYQVTNNTNEPHFFVPEF